MYRAYKFRMYSNSLDEIKLNQNIGSPFFIYNHHIDKLEKLYEVKTRIFHSRVWSHE